MDNHTLVLTRLQQLQGYPEETVASTSRLSIVTWERNRESHHTKSGSVDLLLTNQGADVIRPPGGRGWLSTRLNYANAQQAAHRILVSETTRKSHVTIKYRTEPFRCCLDYLRNNTRIEQGANLRTTDRYCFNHREQSDGVTTHVSSPYAPPTCHTNGRSNPKRLHSDR